MIDRIGADLNFYQEVVSLRHQRQQVLASNIANADTPNYKARDFDFRQTLSQALESSSVKRPGDVSLSLTSERHIPASAQSSTTVDLQYRQMVQPSLDGNTVDMDLERVQFADNTQRYQADIAILSSRIKGILSALQQ